MSKVPMVMFVSLMLATSIAGGQQKGEEGQGPVGIFESQNQYHSFMGGMKELAQADPALREMIPFINDVVLNQPIGETAQRYGGVSSHLGILGNPKVREELGIVDDQFKQLEAANDDFRKQMAREVLAIDVNNKSNLSEVGDRLRDMRERANQELEAVLLPHQIERLRQVYFRQQLRQRSLVDILTNEPVRSDLGISSEQTEELRKAEQEIEQDLQRQIAKLREQARSRLLGKLKPDQRQRAEKLLGDEFDFNSGAKSESRGEPKAKR